MDTPYLDDQPKHLAGAKITLILVLVSESAFFATLVMSFMYLRANQAGFPSLQPSFSQLVLPGIITAILLFSALFAQRAIAAIRKGDQPGLRNGLWITGLLGLIFVLGQVVEYSRSGMAPDDPALGGVFFALMGFHALHVLAGMFVIALLLWRTWQGDFDAQDHVPVEVGVWFWYFVVLVWVVLFTVLYLV